MNLFILVISLLWITSGYIFSVHEKKVPEINITISSSKLYRDFCLFPYSFDAPYGAVVIKLDTGMWRNGCRPADLNNLVQVKYSTPDT